MKRRCLLRSWQFGCSRRLVARSTATIAAASVFGLASPRASGQSPGTPTADVDTFRTKLELELPLGCGNLAKFVERLRSRSNRIRFSDQEADRTVQARIAAETDGTYRATMTLLYPDGHSSSRIIEARNCSEAIDALALVTAVALDPLSFGVTDTPAALPTPPKPPSSTKLPEPVVRPVEPDTSVPAPPNPYTRLGLGVSFATYRGPVPGWLVGFEPNVRLMSTRRSAFSPSARLGFSYTQNRGNREPGGIADFALASLELDLCPWQLLSQSIELRSCALGHGGLVFAEGRATTEPESHLRQYWAVGASAEVEWMPARTFAIPLRLAASLPLVRDTYAFNPVSFYKVPVVSFGITAGLEVRFR